jgi:formate dehydrogenase major subunit
MATVKLEINGKRVTADPNQTILQAARQHGIDDIPTLCNDEQLEPFASCYLCVVKVKGARTLLPACTTKVTAGMVVETNTPEIRRSRQAALELLLSNHYADCIGPCQLACPASVDIQGYVALAAMGKYTEALHLIKEKNPLPAICGRVCTRPCEVTGCRRNLLDKAVGIDYIKRYVADLHLGKAPEFHPAQAARKQKKVAVVGAGPAGLSCAYYLALQGYPVQMFESMPEAGGMLRYGIPQYRLPKEILDLEVSHILDLGVKLSTNVALGKDFTVAGLKEKGFDAVFLGLGAWESSSMKVKDENAEGVLSGIKFLENFGLKKPLDLKGTVLVVGGGNTAIDCARTALRVGAKEVKLLYRRTRHEMPANAVEIEEAEHEGVHMEFLVAPTRVIVENGRAKGVECQRMELGEPDASGRRSPKPVRGSEFQIAGDWVIAAIGQSTKMAELFGKGTSQLPSGEALSLTKWQTIQVEEGTQQTSVEGVFSGGDVVTGAATAVEAIAAGRKAAHAIDRYLETGKAEPEPREFFSRKDSFGKIDVSVLKWQTPSQPRPMPVIPEQSRKGSFAEVELGYTQQDVATEAARCQECGCTALFDCDLRRYATEYRVELKSFMGEAKQHQVDRSHPLLELDQNKCILCGRCVRMCSEVVGVNAYGFIHRGFNTVVKPVLGGSLLDTDCVSCGLCLGTCPTGAIAQKLPLPKPGPWVTAATDSLCHYCGVGCRVNYESYGDTFIQMSRIEENPVTMGGHCRKGIFAYDYLENPDRLLRSRIRSGSDLREATLEEALDRAGKQLREALARCAPEEVALFVSPRLTNEEIYLAQKLARVGFKTHNVASFANLVNSELDCPEVVSDATYRDLAGAQTILVVNSRLDEEHFVVDLLAKRAIRAGGKLVYIGNEPDRTSETAEVFLRCRPGTETQVVLGLAMLLAEKSQLDLGKQPELAKALAGLRIDEVAKQTGVDRQAMEEAAAVLARQGPRVTVFNKDHRGPRVAGDERLFAALAGAMGGRRLALREKSNMQGLLDMGASPEWLPGYVPVADPAAGEGLAKQWGVVLREVKGLGGNLARALRQKKIRVAVVLGEDPLGNPAVPADLREGLAAAELLVVGDLFLTETARRAQVVLPLSSTAETSGTMTNQERRLQVVNRAVAPHNGMENWQLLCELGARLGQRFKMRYATAAEVTAEIKQVVPLYRDLDPSDPTRDAVWNLAGFPLASGSVRGLANGKVVTPCDTLGLDVLEGRFERRMTALFEEARKQQAQAAAG